jgi:hypothetical protein
MTVESLVEELRSLAGVSSSIENVVDEEVDWIIPADDMDDDARALLMRLGGRSQQMAEEENIDARIKETLKGSLETLAKRIEGITDLVDLGKLGSVQVALEKVLKDGATLFDSISTGKKKEQAQSKKDKQKSQDPPEPKSQEDQKADKGDKSGGKPGGKPALKAQQQGGGTFSRGAPQAPLQGGGGEKAVTRTQESVVIIGSEVITEAQMADPFGMGESFKADIVRMATAKKKHPEG